MVQFDLESQIRGQAEPHLSARDRGADVVQAGGERRRKRQSIHQADVFYDLDAAGTVAGAAVSLVHFGPGSLFFLRAQKPLPFDISGKGVERGYRADWDNIHPGHPSGERGLGTRAEQSWAVSCGAHRRAHLQWVFRYDVRARPRAR